MTGAELVSFAQAFAHLYDIHAEAATTSDCATAENLYCKLYNDIDATRPLSAWDKGVKA